MVQPDRPQMIIWRMDIACRVTKATNRHSGYVTHLAFPWQQWLHERTSLLRLYFTLFTLLAGLPMSLQQPPHPRNKQTNKHGAYAHETNATAILRRFIDECGLLGTTTFDKTRGCFERLRRLGLTILLKVNPIKVMRYVILTINTDRFDE